MLGADFQPRLDIKVELVVRILSAQRVPRPGATSPGLPNRRQGLLLGERPARCPRPPAPATSRYVHSAGPVGGGSRSRFQKSLCTEVPELPSARWGDCPSGVRGSGCWELKLPYPGAWVKWPEEGREQLGLVPDRWAGNLVRTCPGPLVTSDGSARRWVLLVSPPPAPPAFTSYALPGTGAVCQWDPATGS